MSTRKPVLDWTVDFDILAPEWAENPYAIWSDLRQKCPVAHTGRFGGVFLPTRHEDVQAIAYDTEHFSSRRVIVREGAPLIAPAPPITSDPPEHTTQKRLLLPAFSPAAIARYEPGIRIICRELLNRVEGRKSCDGAVDYAQEVSTCAIALMFGLHARDGELFRNWVQDFYEHGVADQAEAVRVLKEVREFFYPEIAKRRVKPDDGLITFLIEAQIDGQPLTDDFIVDTLRVLLFAGIDTTWSAIGSCLWHLATHPEDCKRLVAEPQLIPTAIEEFLRAYAPITSAREIVKGTEVGGCPFHEGQMVLLSFAAANRDPALFLNPDSVIIDRTPNRHVAFGLGIHRCLGSNLARMEMTVALEEWLGKFPEFNLAPTSRVSWSEGQARGPRRLPLVLGRADS